MQSRTVTVRSNITFFESLAAQCSPDRQLRSLNRSQQAQVSVESSPSQSTTELEVVDYETDIPQGCSTSRVSALPESTEFRNRLNEILIGKIMKQKEIKRDNQREGNELGDQDFIGSLNEVRIDNQPKTYELGDPEFVAKLNQIGIEKIRKQQEYLTSYFDTGIHNSYLLGLIKSKKLEITVREETEIKDKEKHLAVVATDIVDHPPRNFNPSPIQEMLSYKFISNLKERTVTRRYPRRKVQEHIPSASQCPTFHDHLPVQPSPNSSGKPTTTITGPEQERPNIFRSFANAIQRFFYFIN